MKTIVLVLLEVLSQQKNCSHALHAEPVEFGRNATILYDFSCGTGCIELDVRRDTDSSFLYSFRWPNSSFIQPGYEDKIVPTMSDNTLSLLITNTTWEDDTSWRFLLQRKGCTTESLSVVLEITCKYIVFMVHHVYLQVNHIALH